MKAQGVGPLRLPRRSRLAGRVCSRPRAWGRRTAYVQATSRAQSGAQRGIIFFAATEVRILPARHIEQPRRHAVHPCAPAMPGEILAAAARWQRRSPDANCLCRAVSAKSAGIPRQYARILIPTDSAVRVRPPQPTSAVCHDFPPFTFVTRDSRTRSRRGGVRSQPIPARPSG